MVASPAAGWVDFSDGIVPIKSNSLNCWSSYHVAAFRIGQTVHKPEGLLDCDGIGDVQEDKAKMLKSGER